jgi:hypothetical protein
MTLVSSALQRLITKLTARNPSDELQQLPPDELRTVARDLDLSEQDLLALSARDPSSSDLLYRRLEALGLHPAHIDRVAHGLRRDLEQSCSCCGDQATCATDLAKDPDGEGWKGYCPNANSLAAVVGTKGRFPV